MTPISVRMRIAGVQTASPARKCKIQREASAQLQVATGAPQYLSRGNVSFSSSATLPPA